MPVVYVKDPHKREREKLTVDSLQVMTVQNLKILVAEKLSTEAEQLMLMYAGRVLKHGKTLDEYNIIEGVTIFFMKKKIPQKSISESSTNTTSQLRKIIRNPRVHQILSQMVSNPMLLFSMIRGTPLENNPAIQGLVQDPELRSNLSDPEELIKALESNPEDAEMIESILRTVGASVLEETGCNQEEVEDELVDMMEQSLEEGMEFLDGDEEEGEGQEIAEAQDLMYHHSQALLAHQQSQTQLHPQNLSVQENVVSESMETVPNVSLPQHETTVNLSRQVSGNGNTTSPAITQNMLTSALAIIHGSQTSDSSSSGPSSLPTQLPQPSQSGPSSLPSQTTEGMDQNSSGPSSLPGRSLSTPGSGISPVDLQLALQNIMQPGTSNQTSSQPSGQQHRHRHRRHHSHRSDRQPRYHNQLQQLKSMGLSDEASILHALEATNGDINAALEILLGGQ